MLFQHGGRTDLGQIDFFLQETRLTASAYSRKPSQAELVLCP